MSVVGIGKIFKPSDVSAVSSYSLLGTNYTSIRQDLKNRSGVYMFYNIITGQCYIGSSVDLERRLRAHKHLVGRSPRPLYRAMHKYGLDAFMFFLLEECDPTVLACIQLEQSYLDEYGASDSPHYNILPIAGASDGYNHTPEMIRHLSEIHQGVKHPRFGTSPTPDQRAATSSALKAYYDKYGHHNAGKKGVNAPQYGIGGKAVHCYSSDGQYLEYPSINATRTALKTRHSNVANNIDKGPVVIRNIT